MPGPRALFSGPKSTLPEEYVKNFDESWSRWTPGIEWASEYAKEGIGGEIPGRQRSLPGGAESSQATEEFPHFFEEFEQEFESQIHLSADKLGEDSPFFPGESRSISRRRGCDPHLVHGTVSRTRCSELQ